MLWRVCWTTLVLAGKRFAWKEELPPSSHLSSIMSELTPDALKNALSEPSIQNVVVQVLFPTLRKI